MTRSLPGRPSLTHVKHEAKALLAAHHQRDTRVLPILRHLVRLARCSDQQILEATVSLQEVQHALAKDYGFPDWTALKNHVKSSTRLAHGAALDWRNIIAGHEEHCEIIDDVLVVENPVGEGAALHVEFGGMSWDNYRLGVTFLVERDSSPGRQYPCNVQLCPRGTTVFCQVFGNSINLAYWDENREPHFTHLLPPHAFDRQISPGVWHRFEIQVNSPTVCIFFDNEEVACREVPIGAVGMPGLVVNYGSDARVRLKDFHIRFATPTRRQVTEFNKPPEVNWENYKREQVETGQRESMDDNTMM